MGIIYNFLIRVHWFAIFLASFFNSKAKLWIVGRRGWKQNLPEVQLSDELIWFHCASLGEFDQGLPVMREIKSTNPSTKILVTFFSPSGMLHYTKREHDVDYVCYLPIDLPSNVHFFLNHFSPVKIFIVKYEFWANFIEGAQVKGIPVYSLCSNFREDQHFFKWYGFFFRNVLRRITYFFVQTQTSVRLLNSIGIENVMEIGDTRFDNVIFNKNCFTKQINSGIVNSDWEKIRNFLQGDKAIIIGSSWPKEEELIIPFIVSNPDYKFILAPHDISEKHILKIKKSLANKAIRFSEFEEYSLANCLILDTIGHLTKAYYFGKLAIVGGGFSGNLHNILEPVAFGLPVLIGPEHSRFPEAKLFLEKGIAFEFKKTEDIELHIEKIMENLKFLSKKAEEIMQSNLGASKKINNLSIAKSIELISIASKKNI
ncbi:MAG: 3-deoxy-D-manno-octulosonic acid transferase [Bacteroidetes bacterium]|nr:3-deoxy-D-manno-octulosonic acid transferase [Bacteroidota bacterium]